MSPIYDFYDPNIKGGHLVIKDDNQYKIFRWFLSCDDYNNPNYAIYLWKWNIDENNVSVIQQKTLPVEEIENYITNLEFEDDFELGDNCQYSQQNPLIMTTQLSFLERNNIINSFN